MHACMHHSAPFSSTTLVLGVITSTTSRTAFLLLPISATTAAMSPCWAHISAYTHHVIDHADLALEHLAELVTCAAMVAGADVW